MKFKIEKFKYAILPAIILLILPLLAFSQDVVIDPDTGLPVPVFRGGVIAGECLGGYSLIASDFRCFIAHVINLINLLIPVLFGVAFIVFFWGLSKFILGSGKPEEIVKGKSYMFWGIVALFAMVSLRAILDIVANNLLEIGDVKVLPLLRTDVP